MNQKKFGVACAALTCLMLGLCFASNPSTAEAQGKKKFDPKKLKIIINKVDPEIRVAQKALQVARTDLLRARAAISKAMSDEVFSEKGPTEAAAIDQLKASLKACNNALADVNVAIARANLAQLVDKGGD